MIKSSISKTFGAFMIALLVTYSFTGSNVLVASAEDPLPDLTVDSILVTPTEPDVDETVSLVVTVSNSGSVDITDATGMGSGVYENIFADFISTSVPEPEPIPSGGDILVPGGTVTYTWSGSFDSAGDKDLSFTIDNSGNLAEDNETNNTATTTVTVIQPDVTAPAITVGPWTTELGANSVVINWTTDETSTSTVEYGLTNIYSASTTVNVFVTNHAILISDLVSETSYHYRVSSADEFNNRVVSGDFPFTTLEDGTPPPDETKPVISGIVVSDITPTSTVISWDTDELASSVLDYGTTDAYGTSKSSADLVTAHSFLLPGLTPSTTYHFMVGSTDESSNEATSTDQTFETLAESIVDDDDDGDDDDSSDKITICHKTGSKKKGFNIITISKNAWPAHERHGDDVYDDGECGGEIDDVDDGSPSSSAGKGVLAKLRARIKQLEYKVSHFENNVVKQARQLVKRINKTLSKRLHGHILLQVENNGEAWYVDEDSDQRYYLQNGRSAYQALQVFGLGISNVDLEKIPIGLNERFVHVDTDGDGLPDQLEISLGSDPNNPDTDGDGINDKQELLNDYSPAKQKKFSYDNSLISRLTGKILLQVEEHGEAWWINPSDNKRYYMKDGDAAYNIMRFLSLGISNGDLQQIDVGSLEAE